EEADQSGQQDRLNGRQARAEKQRQREIDAASDEALDDDDLHRIGRGELPREVVVDAPAETGTGNQQRRRLEARRSLPGEQNRTAKNRGGTQEQPAIDILTEDQPGDRHGG